MESVRVVAPGERAAGMSSRSDLPLVPGVLGAPPARLARPNVPSGDVRGKFMQPLFVILLLLQSSEAETQCGIHIG